MIEACYRALDLITFLTTGEDETRAWEVRRGAKAPEAAGVIHTDLERGFIRAEVIGYDELVAPARWTPRSTTGKIRVEGKDYEVAGRRHPARPLRGLAALDFRHRHEAARMFRHTGPKTYQMREEARLDRRRLTRNARRGRHPAGDDPVRGTVPTS